MYPGWPRICYIAMMAWDSLCTQDGLGFAMIFLPQPLRCREYMPGLYSDNSNPDILNLKHGFVENKKVSSKFDFCHLYNQGKGFCM